MANQPDTLSDTYENAPFHLQLKVEAAERVDDLHMSMEGKVVRVYRGDSAIGDSVKLRVRCQGPNGEPAPAGGFPLNLSLAVPSLVDVFLDDTSSDKQLGVVGAVVSLGAAKSDPFFEENDGNGGGLGAVASAFRVIGLTLLVLGPLLWLGWSLWTGMDHSFNSESFQARERTAKTIASITIGGGGLLTVFSFILRR